MFACYALDFAYTAQAEYIAPLLHSQCFEAPFGNAGRISTKVCHSGDIRQEAASSSISSSLTDVT